MSASGGGTSGRRRQRSPSYPPFVEDYRPYTGGQLRRLCTERAREDHKGHWDVYYRNNTVNGYKDRHYIYREFVELREAIEAARSATAEARPFSWMEAGCGVGNAMLPIYEEHGELPQWRSLLGFDISSVAVGLLDKKVAELPEALAKKVHTCALDPCERDVADCPFFTPVKEDDATAGAGHVSPSSSPSAPAPSPAVPRSPANRVEFVSMVFVLCSIPVANHSLVLRRIAACMTEPGGVFFFRDYAVSDHAESRFRQREQQVSATTDSGASAEADATTYARTNGTLSHFFSVAEVQQLFTSVGFAVIDLKEVEREVQNRKTETVLSRRFVQGRFRLEKLKLSD